MSAMNNTNGMNATRAGYRKPYPAAITEMIRSCPTPFYVYDETAIRANVRRLYRAFDWIGGGSGTDNGFLNYFAVKALPNPHILQILRDEGLGFDCSSMAELELAERVGASGDEIMFTSNDTPAEDFRRARQLGAIINLDDISHIDYLQRHAGMPTFICMRYNPGPLKEGNILIGRPEEAKYGFTREQMFAGYRRAGEHGATNFGLHTMVASNELSVDYLVATARLLFELAVELQERAAIRIELIDLGGGIGIPYHPTEQAVDYESLSAGIRRCYEDIIKPAGLHPIRIVMENGRAISGPHGFLVARALHKKETYRSYIGLDANMANLMRPGMYGAYHHISVIGTEPDRENNAENEPVLYDVTGGLCENNDKFAIQRPLPSIAVGDFVILHDAGAHGHSMGFNYNGRLRSAEWLLESNGSWRQIRRAETLADHFATLDFSSIR